MSQEKAVAILTTFQDLPSTYGLVPVVLNQIKMLVKYGYEVGFYTQAGFEDHLDAGDVPEGAEMIPRVPFCHLYDYRYLSSKKQKHDVPPEGIRHEGNNKNKTNFDKQVKLIEDELDSWLMEYPTIITHDILLQTWFLPHNQAIRNIAERHPEIRWIHWLHSGPSPRPKKLKHPHTLRFTGMPNSVFVSPNETMRQKFAEMYNVPLKNVRTVYHTIDPVKWFELHPLSIELIEKHRLYNCDGLVVWATRMDHPTPKGMDKAVHLLGRMNRFADIKLLFLNSASDTPQAKGNMKFLKNEAREWGLPPENLIFSSEMGSKWEKGVPHEVVKNMYSIGNIFILPSQTETFSLAMLEASLHKNMLILNENLAVLSELAGDRADYFGAEADWGGTKWWAHDPENKNKKIYKNRTNEEIYLDRVMMGFLGRLGIVDYRCEHCGKPLAKIGAYNPLRQHRHTLKYYSVDWVFKNQLELLLRGEW